MAETDGPLFKTHPSPSDPTKAFGISGDRLVPLVGSQLFNWGMSLPFLRCPLLRLTGIPCPAWGLTRSFMAMVRGDWQQAIAYHLFGPLLFAGFAIAAGHLLLEIIRGCQVRVFYLEWSRSPRLQISAFVILLIYHGFRLYSLAQAGELYQGFIQSPLARSIFVNL